MISILSVEDSDDDSRFLGEVVAECCPEGVITFASDAEAATTIIAEYGFFDIAILDLRIPYSRDTKLDIDAQHGMSIMHHLREHIPGVPIIILTGSRVETLVDQFMAHSERQDVWGTNAKRPTIDYCRKDDKRAFREKFEERVADIRRLSDCDFRNQSDLNLSVEVDRLIRIATKRQGGASYKVKSLNGGKSSSDVYAVEVLGGDGNSLISLVLKIDSHDQVHEEAENVRKFVHRLDAGATPRFLETLDFGGGKKAALVYSLLSSATGDFFSIAQDADACQLAVNSLAENLRPWHSFTGESSTTIREARQVTFADAKHQKVCEKFELDWVPAFEARAVQIHRSIIHGDLHGGNVLISGEGRPNIIDFNDITDGSASFDWVSLELSLLFNISGPARDTEWPRSEQTAQWLDVDRYVEDSPFEEAVRACRSRAEEAATGQRELGVAAYSYLIRQLSYPDTDKPRILSLLGGIRETLNLG